MPIDYAAITRENTTKYGTEIARVGETLLSGLYADRTHFIYEILQNTEDALAKRGEWNGDRAVNFALSADAVTISHCGKPFDELDVRGICGIVESTKAELTAIGRFGIGFKSVYAYADAPEIHSGGENFVIKHYVCPYSAQPLDAPHPEKTVIRIPFKPDIPDAKNEIAKGLRSLNARSLLFLRQIESIRWSDDAGHSGGYSRSEPEAVGKIARKVTLTQQGDDDGASEDWLVFSRDVFHEDAKAGSVEIAFKLSDPDGEKPQSIEPALQSRLVVFFPTAVPTHMGFVMQGPYRTTPSRENVPVNDAWNRYLISETAELLIDALIELRELGMLNVAALQCLPLDSPTSYPYLYRNASGFAPIHAKLKSALLTERLIPAHPRGYAAGQNAKIARGGPLRSLLSRDRLTALTASSAKQIWLSEEITENRTPTLHSYLTDTLGIEEITPEWLVSKLTKWFLENQPDNWIIKLYSFLNSQSALRYRLRMEIPIVRLEDGIHVRPFFNYPDKPQAYLPGESKTGFPTVRTSVCKSDDALAFLKSLGLRKPDPVDDVIEHIIPRYKRGSVDIAQHEEDIRRMLRAHATDSSSQRYRLMSELRKTPFVVAVDSVSGATQFACPEQAYMPTEALRSLFEGVPGVLFADRSQDYMRGDAVRILLRSVGTSEHLARKSVARDFTCQEKLRLRGYEGSTRTESTQDYTLMGLDALFTILPNLPVGEATNRAKLLWDALCAFQQNTNANSFSGAYEWFYYSEKSAHFPAQFVNLLNQTAWVPDKDGALRQPNEVVFEDTGWQENYALTSRIEFMPDTLNQLAEEAGVDADAIRLLKEHNLTGEDLKEFIAAEAAEQPDVAPPEDAATAAQIAEGGAPYPNPSRDGATQGDRPILRGVASGGSGNGNRVATDNGRLRPTNPRPRFVSYVAVSPDENDAEPDGLGNEERRKLESQALAFVISEEPSLRQTPANNIGYDLFETDADGNKVKYVEVKSMTAALDDRPATLSAAQFKFAQEKGNAFWLYIVERADSSDRANIIPIQDPAGKARAFTFDKGWLQAAHR